MPPPNSSQSAGKEVFLALSILYAPSQNQSSLSWRERGKNPIMTDMFQVFVLHTFASEFLIFHVYTMHCLLLSVKVEYFTAVDSESTKCRLFCLHIVCISQHRFSNSERPFRDSRTGLVLQVNSYVFQRHGED